MWSGFAPTFSLTDCLVGAPTSGSEEGACKNAAQQQHTPRKRLGRGARGGIATTTTWIADALALHARVYFLTI